MKILWVNACGREESRTRKLTEAFLSAFLKHHEAHVEEVRLFEEKELNWFDWTRVCERTAFQKQQDWQQPMFKYARQWRAADRIIISAPYWDLAFPAVVKVYMENVFVTGLTFYYDEHGVPRGLCRADKLLYVTTAGGFVQGSDLGYEYMKACAKMFEIPVTERIAAEGLDVRESDCGAIFEKALKEVVTAADLW